RQDGRRVRWPVRSGVARRPDGERLAAGDPDAAGRRPGDLPARPGASVRAQRALTTASEVDSGSVGRLPPDPAEPGSVPPGAPRPPPPPAGRRARAIRFGDLLRGL